MHEAHISYAAHRKLRNRAIKTGKPPLLASKRKIDVERRSLEDVCKYLAEEDVIRLQNISSALLARLDYIGGVEQTVLLSADKGQGRVLVTAAFPYRNEGKNMASHPCSESNHLVLLSWKGQDKYDALSSRCSNVYQILVEELKLKTLVGGDCSFLCAIVGKHSSMIEACPWCDHMFDKSRSAEKDLIPFVPVVLPGNKKTVERKLPIWGVKIEYLSIFLYFLVGHFLFRSFPQFFILS